MQARSRTLSAVAALALMPLTSFSTSSAVMAASLLLFTLAKHAAAYRCRADASARSCTDIFATSAAAHVPFSASLFCFSCGDA